MKIHFDNVNFQAKTGPCTFARRLATELFSAGHEVTTDYNDAELSLVFIEPTGQKLSKTIVQRLDGIWTKPEEFVARNKPIRDLYDIASAVIWQSQFDHDMITKWWGKRDGKIIRNGIDIKPVTTFSSPELAQIRSGYKLVLTCSSNWHPQKRLNANVNLFKHIRSTIEPSTCLIVMGNNPDVMVPDKNIFYTGSLPEHLYLEVFSMADWTLHLAYCDHAPNVIIESISQNTPVICSDVGGTKEIVGEFGMVLKEKLPFSFEPFDYDKPPYIDVTQLTKLPKKGMLGKSSEIDIKSITVQYIQLFEDLLRKNS